MFRKLFRVYRTQPSPRQCRGQRSYRPALEALEIRCVPSTVNWTLLGNGDFNDPNNWLDVVDGSHHVPGPSDNAVVNTSGINVTLSADAEVESLACNAQLTLLGTTLTIDGVGSDSYVQNLVLPSSATLKVNARTFFLTGGGDISGTLDAEANSTIAFNEGDYTVNAGTVWNFAGQYTILASFETVINVTANLTAPPNFEMDGGNLVIPANDTLTVPGTFAWTGGTIDGPGTVLIQNGAALNILGSPDKDLNDAVTLTNQGTGTWTGVGRLNVVGSAVFNNDVQGTFTVANTNDVVVVSANYSPGTIDNAGTWIQNSGFVSTNLFIGPYFNNTGTVQVNQGQMVLLSGGAATGTFTATANGSLIFNGGTYTLDPGADLSSAGIVQVASGTLEVNATVSAMSLAVLNGGTLQIDSNGVVNVSGDYTLQAGGYLVVQLGGTTPGAGSAQLNVAGTANLAGTLAVTFVDIYLPNFGDSYPVLTFGSLNGSFSDVSLPGLAPSEQWNAVYDANDFTLTVASA
jgi:hypothetical protein